MRRARPGAKHVTLWSPMKTERPVKPERRNETDALLDGARRLIDEEIDGLQKLRDRLGPELARAVDAIRGCRGRVIVSGVGKSGQIAHKIASTLTSTGTPS